jgi:lipoprotein-anchoring transpeptidase ErfK/SrfK
MHLRHASDFAFDGQWQFQPGSVKTLETATGISACCAGMPFLGNCRNEHGRTECVDRKGLMKDSSRFTRRAIVLSGLSAVVSGCAPSFGQAVRPVGFPMPPGPDPRFRRQRVRYDGAESPGTIVVNTSERFLYAIEADGWATRYGVAVGEEGLTLKGRASVGRKAEWPSWTPTSSMIKRKPWLVEYAGGVPGGENNPLGARALYLYRGSRDTMFRVHGTNEPWLIGTAVSNGCIRLTNEDIIELYDRTPLGTSVVVI